MSADPQDTGANWELAYRSGAWDRARAEVDDTCVSVLADPTYKGADDACPRRGGGWQAHINGMCP